MCYSAIIQQGRRPAVAEVQELMKRLEVARNRADELEKEKSRLTGELEATKKRLGELENKCKEEFDCDVKELPGFIKQLEDEAEKSLKNAEGVLGMDGPEPAKPDEDDGTSGQDRESYEDDQDRENYTPEDDEDALV